MTIRSFCTVLLLTKPSKQSNELSKSRQIIVYTIYTRWRRRITLDKNTFPCIWFVRFFFLKYLNWFFSASKWVALMENRFNTNGPNFGGKKLKTKTVRRTKRLLSPTQKCLKGVSTMCPMIWNELASPKKNESSAIG